MKLRNINPVGDVYVPELGREWPRGAVFWVDDDLGAQLLQQVGNYERVSDDEPLENAPGVVERLVWPTPAWWGQTSTGWELVLLRCTACHRLAARFFVQATTRSAATTVVPVGRAIAHGRWVRADDRRPENRTPRPCVCNWGAFPPVTDPRMHKALVLALSGTQPPRVFGGGVPRRLDAQPHLAPGKPATLYATPNGGIPQ